ncbi:hypothetical protein B566_EDAN017862 [Ephemera danica]|nr:hypothetical protein B566_EDAN017862 [Ephemera danica]
MLFAHSELTKNSNGFVFLPKNDKRLVLICNELNLPDENGFYHHVDHHCASLSRIQFVGACNPPSHSGQKNLPIKFLRHFGIIFVDHPSKESLFQIYSKMNDLRLKSMPNLKIPNLVPAWELSTVTSVCSYRNAPPKSTEERSDLVQSSAPLHGTLPARQLGDDVTSSTSATQNGRFLIFVCVGV